MKRDWKKARKVGIQQKFENWCEANNCKPDPDAFIAFDEANGKVFLNHKEAQEKGYYYHLRMQAASIISSWATVETLKVSRSSTPAASQVISSSDRVRLQYSYDIPGKGATPVSKMNEGDLTWLIKSFQIESEMKIKRAYILANKLEVLTVTRKSVRDAFQSAEQAAYESVSKS